MYRKSEPRSLSGDKQFLDFKGSRKTRQRWNYEISVDFQEENTAPRVSGLKRQLERLKFSSVPKIVLRLS
jgi:hypothetical protein